MKFFTLILFIDFIVILISILTGKEINFKEGHFLTWFSFLQLLLISFFFGKTFWVKLKKEANFSLKSSYLVWAFISIGFLFLSFDEILEIHESLDVLIHDFFKITESKQSDRIDDLIVGFYLLVGSAILYFYKDELKKYNNLSGLVIIAFLFILIMIGIDLLTNRKDILRSIILDKPLRKAIFSWLIVIEETFKIFAEGILISISYLLTLARASR